MDLAAVKASWAEELAVFRDHPKALQAALENLPEKDPPTVLQFRALCRPYLLDERQEVPPALPAPKADLEKVAELMATIQRDDVHDPKEWARKLRAREEYEAKHDTDQRSKMTAYQRDAWRKALS